MNRFDTLANSILESLNEADAANVATNITNKLPTKIIPAADVQKMFPKANITGTNQPPVAPTSTNQPPRNVGGIQPTYDPNKDPLLKGVPGFKGVPGTEKAPLRRRTRPARDITPNLQKYLDMRKQMDAERAARDAAYLKKRQEMDANKTKQNFKPQP